MSPPSSEPSTILSQLQSASSTYTKGKPGAREQLLNRSHTLISSLELPSEAIQRMGWAEVSTVVTSASESHMLMIIA